MICILNTAYKILSIILCERLKPYLSSIIRPYQCGFRPGKSTVDQMFTLRQILEKTHEFNVDTHHLFIDFKQAYDSIRDKLLSAMYALGIPAKLVNMCRLTLRDTKSLAKVDGEKSEPYITTKFLVIFVKMLIIMLIKIYIFFKVL